MAGSPALILVPVIWRVRDAVGESRRTWIRFDSEIDLIRPKGDVWLPWRTQGDDLLTQVNGWSTALGPKPPTVPWLTSATTFTRNGEGWVLTDANGRRTARLVRDGTPPPSRQTLHSVPTIDTRIRAQHIDAVAGASVRALDPAAAVGTWGLPGIAAKDGSVTFGADGTWTARTSCEVLGNAEGGAGAYRLLPSGILLTTESFIGGTGCAAPQVTPPADATAVVDFVTAGSIAIDGSRMRVYDRTGKHLGTLQRKS